MHFRYMKRKVKLDGQNIGKSVYIQQNLFFYFPNFCSFILFVLQNHFRLPLKIGYQLLENQCTRGGDENVPAAKRRRSQDLGILKRKD